MSELQRTPEWHLSRLGCLTGSRIADAMDYTKKGEGAKRINYRLELLAERLTGIATPFFVNQAMQWGIDTENAAREAYEAETGELVIEVGFIRHPILDWAGASPDGLIGNDGLVEIKCPNTTTHLSTILTGEIAEKYKLQMTWQLLCTQRKWCDFVSFDPRLPEELQLYITRYKPSAEELLSVDMQAKEFLESVELLSNKLTKA